MKKVTFILCAAIFSTVFVSEVSHGQSAIVGPRIVHEEEEITVFDDGKEIEKYYVGKYGEQKNAIMKDAYEKKRKIKIKDVQQTKLKFYDENGNVIKEIDLSSEKSRGRIKETRPLYKKGEFDAEMETVKRPKVSQNGKYAAMDNTTYARAGYTVPLGKLVLFNVTGNVLFEKQYPHGGGIEGQKSLAIADSGTVAVITSETDEGPHNEILYAYDKTGKELLAYPQHDDKAHPQEVLRISPNGRYLATSVWSYLGSDITVFFDLEKNMSWKAGKDYVVYELSDNGIVKAYYQDEAKGGPSDAVEIDLKTRMKP